MKYYFSFSFWQISILCIIWKNIFNKLLRMSNTIQSFPINNNSNESQYSHRLNIFLNEQKDRFTAHMRWLYSSHWISIFFDESDFVNVHQKFVFQQKKDSFILNENNIIETTIEVRLPEELIQSFLNKIKCIVLAKKLKEIMNSWELSQDEYELFRSVRGKIIDWKFRLDSIQDTNILNLTPKLESIDFIFGTFYFSESQPVLWDSHNIETPQTWVRSFVRRILENI